MHEKALTASLQTDIGIATTLLELIEAEFVALTEKDLPTLQQVLGEKQPLLTLLAQHATLRSQTLRQLGLSPDRDGLRALAERSEAGDQMLQGAEKLAELIETLQSSNQRNGKLIRANQTSLASVLGIMRGTDVPDLYDSKGSTARIAQQKPLSQA